MLRTSMQRNADPLQILQESAQNGTITIDNFQEMKSMYTMLRRFGVKKFNISDEQFNQIEQTIRNASSNRVNKNNGGFKRF